ncbi:MAG: PhzF family phenazine biosynthesis isomerase [Parachlamydiales bacterium]|jgi:PhzF family phenazine biosynthesis protein
MKTKQLIRAIVNLFFPLVEATFFNAKDGAEEIINSFSSHKEDQEINRNYSESPSIEQLKSGKKVKTMLYSLEEGCLRLRMDLNFFFDLHKQLESVLITEADIGNTGNENWERSIDQIISQYFRNKEITLEAATQKDKRELVVLLQRQGLFDYKEASAYIALKIQTSRATVYNYLKTATSLKKVQVHQVDAFTDKRFGGNPAGVVLDAEYLDEPTMKKLTRELNLSETAFVLPSEAGDFRLRYFTPTGHEIGFCGHSTVGALFTIAHEKRFGIEQKGIHKFLVETMCGLLHMETIAEGEDKIYVAYESPKVDLKMSKITPKMIADAAGVSEEVFASYPVQYDATTKILFITVKDLALLKTIEPNPKSFGTFCKEHQCVVICMLTPETFDMKHQFHMRCYAPMVGIPEDPFTGSVLGGLAAYVHQNKLLKKEDTVFWVEQGHFVDRPGFVKVEFSVEDQNYKVKVYAQAIHCFTTEINVS